MKKKILLNLVLISFGMFFLTSSALAISTSVFEGQNLRFEFQNWDVGTLYNSLNDQTYVGQVYDPNTSQPFVSGDGNTDSFALVAVTNINTPSTATLLWWSTATDALSGMVYGIDDTAVFFNPTNITINSTGGFVDLYAKPRSINPELASAPTTPFLGVEPPTDSWLATTGGTLFLQLQFVPGIIPGDSVTTFVSTYGLTTVPIQGSSSGYLKAIGGSAMAYFDTNQYDSIATGADFLLFDTFTSSQPNLTEAAAAQHWLAASTGNAAGQGQAVPEPATLLLLGMGLIGIGVARRFKRS